MSIDKESLSFKRTKYCGEFTKDDAGETVIAVGWVEKQRDLGNLIFIDLRDRTGIIQLTIYENKVSKEYFSNASRCRAEFVIAARGVVQLRNEKNENLKTGEIEICVEQLNILSQSKTPPFEIRNIYKTSLELRSKYRYLELRNKDMQNTLMFRHKIVKYTRDFFDENGFLEIETPILIKSTPEGARDYLVPSRVHKGSFYALPQSPQLYKQLLMVAGYDRYFQIAKCFRDEDLRAHRQPEFTQIDLEMSFVDEEDIININEKYVKGLFSKILNINLETPFIRLNYSQAMEMYGSDKPDIRFEMKIINITEGLKQSNFKIFKSAATSGGVYAINLKDKADKMSRKNIDKLVEFVKTYRAKGLAYSKPYENFSSFEKFLSNEEVEYIYKSTNANKNDIIFIVADENRETALLSLGALRVYLAEKFELYNKNQFAFLWVLKFPLFEYSEEEKRYISKHHPFTAISDEDLNILETQPENCHAKAYDLVLNGCEIGGGSVRINSEEIQKRVFKALNFTESEIEEKFGFLVEAFKYGAPPHAGMAYGLDRLVMIMLKKSSIRDVIAFPKMQNACELMTNSPGHVQQKQLDELNIAIKNN